MDLISRITVHAGDDLRRDEPVLAALRVNLVGSRSAGEWLAEPEAGESLDAYFATYGETPPAVAELDVPVGFILAVTDARVLAFKRGMTGKPKGVIAEWDRSLCTVDTIDRGTRAKVRRFVIGVGPGAVVVVDAPINGDNARAAADALSNTLSIEPVG